MLIEDRDRRLLDAIGRYQRGRAGRGPGARLAMLRGKLGHVWWSLLSGCDISREARIDGSTRLPHPNGVVIHAQAVIEPGCLIMQQVTLGQLAEGGAPSVGRGVYIGAGAKVLGPVRIGEGARIGANAVVLTDIPPHATAVGIPARVVRHGDGGAG